MNTRSETLESSELSASEASLNLFQGRLQSNRVGSIYGSITAFAKDTIRRIRGAKDYKARVNAVIKSRRRGSLRASWLENRTDPPPIYSGLQSPRLLLRIVPTRSTSGAFCVGFETPSLRRHVWLPNSIFMLVLCQHVAFRVGRSATAYLPRRRTLAWSSGPTAIHVARL